MLFISDDRDNNEPNLKELLAYYNDNDNKIDITSDIINMIKTMIKIDDRCLILVPYDIQLYNKENDDFIYIREFLLKTCDVKDIIYLINKEFRQTYNLKLITELKKHLSEHIPNDICERVNGKLYITYNNIKKGTKPVKSVYKDADDIINTIIKSSYIPYLIDGNILYENKSVDGITPFIFKEREKKILYLDLFGSDKLGNLLNVKNEKSNYHRILSGLLDIHSFFIKKSNTPMCSYVNEWSYSNICFNYTKTIIERICIYLIHILIFVKTHISDEFKETVLYKILSKISYDVFIIILENYCL